MSPELTSALAMASKLDRDPDVMQALAADGRRQACTFLSRWPDASDDDELYP